MVKNESKEIEITLELENNEANRDIINKLESVDDPSKYLGSLIREDIADLAELEKIYGGPLVTIYPDDIICDETPFGIISNSFKSGKNTRLDDLGLSPEINVIPTEADILSAEWIDDAKSGLSSFENVTRHQTLDILANLIKINAMKLFNAHLGEDNEFDLGMDIVNGEDHGENFLSLGATLMNHSGMLYANFISESAVSYEDEEGNEADYTSDEVTLDVILKNLADEFACTYQEGFDKEFLEFMTDLIKEAIETCLPDVIKTVSLAEFTMIAEGIATAYEMSEILECERLRRIERSRK